MVGSTNRITVLVAALAVLMLSFAAVAVTSRATNAGGANQTATTADCAVNEADDSTEPKDAAPETDQVDEPCGAQDAADAADANDSGADAQDSGGADDSGEQHAAPGTIDDGKEFLSQATITLDQAIAAARGAASGPLGEVDLQQYQGKLAFNVDIGSSNVKVDAATGAVLGMAED